MNLQGRHTDSGQGRDTLIYLEREGGEQATEVN